MPVPLDGMRRRILYQKADEWGDKISERGLSCCALKFTGRSDTFYT
jgi:hypothetical protein